MLTLLRALLDSYLFIGTETRCYSIGNRGNALAAWHASREADWQAQRAESDRRFDAFLTDPRAPRNDGGFA